MRKTLLQRFEEKIERIPECGCWIWMGASYDGDYGQIRVNWVKKLAHRVSWELYCGPIPAGICVLHQCDTPACVNPRHLFLGTNYDNVQDRDNKNRRTPLKGEFHGCAKLCKADIIKILNDGRTKEAISKDYGVSRTQISRIKHGKSWGHIKHV